MNSIKKESNSGNSKYIKIIKNPYTWLFLILLIFAIITRAQFQFTDSIWNDESENMYYGYIMTQGDVFNKFVIEEGPFTKAVVGFFSLFTKPFHSVRLMSLSFAMLGIIFIFLVGRELKDNVTGLMAAILLSAHHLYWYIGAKGIMDVPLAAMFVITAYCVLKSEHSENKIWAILIGISLMITMFTKRSGVLMLIIVIIYYAITRKKLFFKDKRVQYGLGIPIGIIIIGDIIFYSLYRISMVTRLINYLVSVRGLIDQPLNFTKTLFTFILNPWVIVFFIIGIFFILFYRNKKHLFIFIWLTVIWLFFDINVKGPTLPRYLLILVPAALLITAFGLSELGELVKIFTKKNLNIILIIIAILIAIPFYKSGIILHESKTYSYSGYPEAADWLTRNMEDNAIVFAGSPRTMRGLTRINYYEYPPGNFQGGRLYYLRSPKYSNNESAFEYDVQQNIKQDIPVYVEIDMWEYTQPKWYFPLNEENINNFINKGFNIVYSVQRDIPTQQGMQKAPVILILKHSGIKKEKIEITGKKSEFDYLNIANSIEKNDTTN